MSQCIESLTDKFQFLFEKELIKDLCLFGRLKSYDANVIILDKGEAITSMPIIISGSIKVMTEDKSGHDLLLYYIGFSETCAITLNCCSRKSKSKIRAVTEVPSEVLFIPIEKMESWMIQYSSWRSFVLESFNSRLTEMLEAVDNLAFNNMEGRLIQYLNDKVWVTKSKELNITHAQIAQDLNSSRVVISRIMKKLELDNQIVQHRNKVEVLNV